MVPQLKSKTQVIELLSLHAFEAEDAPGNTFEVNLPPNRYADAASHVGIARELAAIGGWNVDEKKNMWGKEGKEPLNFKTPSTTPKRFSVTVEDPKLCTRYTACLVEGIAVKRSPLWMEQALQECGLRPINNVVDIMNYVMLETGQPLHAFDADELPGGRIIVRHAKKGEKIKTLDGAEYILTPEMLVIADAEHPVAIAGIKGGHGPEVTKKTKRVIIESATFDSVSVYKTSHQLKLSTDASQRFSHAMSPHLAELGLARAASLLASIAGGKLLEVFDSRKKNPLEKVLKLDLSRLNGFIGSNFSAVEAGGYLKRLGFVSREKDLWEVPPYRTDIETHEDLAEEVVRIYGMNRLTARPPHVHLRPEEQDPAVALKEKVRKILFGLGFTELYTHSFIAKDKAEKMEQGRLVELKNPISEEFFYLRPTLLAGLLDGLELNSKIKDSLLCFETGKVMVRGSKGIEEKLMLGVLVASKNRESLFDLKGILQSIGRALGVPDFRIWHDPQGLHKNAPAGFYWMTGAALKCDTGKVTLGVLGQAARQLRGWHIAVAELDMDLLGRYVSEEFEYEPLSRYPSVLRDLSLLVGAEHSIGAIIQSVQLSNTKIIFDVDLIDEYVDPSWKGKQSIALRVVFQSNERTLTAAEVDKEIEKIKKVLKTQYGAELR